HGQRQRSRPGQRGRGHLDPDRAEAAGGARLVARDLRLFYVFRLLATSYLWVPVSVLFPQSRGLGFDQVMLLSAIYSGVIILVEVPTGVLADRIGRRQSMLAGSLAMLAAGVTAYFAHSFTAFAISN